jgi:hypothetical protein
MHFVLSRAVARCQARRLRALVVAAPIPSAIVVALVVLAPLGLARVGSAIGSELTPSLDSAGITDALVLGPCLAAAAAGAVLASSVPTRAGLGQQIAAGPSGNRSVTCAVVLLPAALAALVCLPALAAFALSLASASPGGAAAGVALVAAVVAAVPLGAVAAEGMRIAVRRGRIRLLLGLALGFGAWVGFGAAIGSMPLGLLAPISLTLRGALSAWVALPIACVVAASAGALWVALASVRPDERVRTRKRSHLDAVWRFPVPAAVSAVLARRPDVRHANAAALAFGVVGLVVAGVGGAPPPGPFLLAGTTTLLGSLVAALAGFGVLVTGSWVWLGSPTTRRSIAAKTWLVSLVAAAAPIGTIAALAAVSSGVDRRAAGVVGVLTVIGTAVATVSGALVPWQGEGIGDQASSVAAFVALAIATSLVIGLVAPRLTALGLSGPGVAVVLCVLLSIVAVATVARRLAIGAR